MYFIPDMLHDKLLSTMPAAEDTVRSVKEQRQFASRKNIHFEDIGETKYTTSQSKATERIVNGLQPNASLDSGISKTVYNVYNEGQESPSKNPHESMEDLKFKIRRQYVKEQCYNLDYGYSNEYTSNRYNVYTKFNVLYCPITKCSSTFWKGNFQRIGAGPERRVTSLNRTELVVLRAHELSLLIVRDPYKRLFSAYENKLYHPSLIHWKKVGRPATLFARNITASDSRNKFYGHDVTFPELIIYILDRWRKGLDNDMHFRPMYTLCNPCKHEFRYIAMLETINDDVEYIMEKLRNNYELTDTGSDFSKDYFFRIYHGHIQKVLETKSLLPKIKLPFHRLMLRTWRDLQIRGFMSKNIPFPFDDELVALNVSKEDFFEAIQKGVEATTDKEAAHAQKAEALHQAYRSVPMNDMESLAEYLSVDCQLFGYDNRPQELFDRSNPISTDFVYLDGLE